MMIPTEVLGTPGDVDALLAAVLDQTHDCTKLIDWNGTIRYVGQGDAVLRTDRLGRIHVGADLSVHGCASLKPFTVHSPCR